MAHFARPRGTRPSTWWRANSQKSRTGPDSLAFVSSSKCTNEESYLMQKLARAVIGTNNMDNCSRYCQAPATQGLFRTVGYGGDSGSIKDIENAGLVIIIGSYTAESHPVLATRVKRAHMRIAENLASVGPLATSIAHDINNPLAAATNLLFLLENESLSEEGKHFLATAQRELSRIAHITAQALGFYRSRGELVWFSIATILDDALLLHQDRCSALGIEVSRDYDSAQLRFADDSEVLPIDLDPLHSTSHF
jgi:signal transduction histidine kinase